MTTENSSKDRTDSDDEVFDDEMLSKEEKDLLALFGKPNLILKVGNRRLRVKKELLIANSVVFERMFKSDFKEANAKEIELPGKDPLIFCRFILNISSGCRNLLDGKTAHEILPLAKEYQIGCLLKKIETSLTNEIKGDYIRIDSIVQSILEAEQYEMPQYLDQCIDVASRKMYKQLTKNSHYADITKETRFKISINRLSHIESVYETGKKTMYDRDGYHSQCVIAVEDFEPYMKTY